MRQSLVCCAAALFAACSSEVSKVPCSTDLSCPTGQFCRSGACAPLPGDNSVSVDAPTPVTAGRTLKLTAHTAGAVSWSVASGGGSIDADGTYHAPAAPGSYTVTATSLADASKSATVTVLVVPAPVAAITVQGNVTTFKTYQASVPAQANMHFTWTLGDPAASIVSGQGSNAISFAAGSAATTTVSVHVVNQLLDAADASVSINQVAAPTLPEIRTPSAAHQGASSDASVAAVAGLTYSWTIIGGTFRDTSLAATGPTVSYVAGAASLTKMQITCTAKNAAGDTAVSSVSVLSVGPAAALLSTITAGGGPAVADGTQFITLTVSLFDLLGNPAFGETVVVSGSLSGNSFALGTGTLQAGSITGVTDARGELVVSMASTSAGAQKIYAAFQGTMVSGSVTFNAGLPVASKSTLTADAATAVADGSAKIKFTVTLMDSKGNLVASFPVAMAAAGSSGNVFAPASGSTGASTGGFTSTLSSTVAESKTVTAVVGTGPSQFTLSLSPQTAVSFTPGNPDASATTLTSSLTYPIADNMTTATLTLTVMDKNSNVVPWLNVSFALDGSNNILSPAPVNGAITGTTDAKGVFSVTVKSQTAETKNATVSMPTIVGPPGTVTKGPVAAVTFVGGAAVPKGSSLASDATSVLADGAAKATLTVTLVDSYGNPAANAPFTVLSSGNKNTFSPAAAGNTGIPGVATTRVTLTSITAEAKTVTVAVGSGQTAFTLSLPQPGTITFVPGDPDATQTLLSASPTQVVADNQTTTQITLTVMDANKNLVKGLANVALSSDGTRNTFLPAADSTGKVIGTTDASGQLKVTLATSKAELKNITVTMPRTQSPGSVTKGPVGLVTFVAGPATVSGSSITATPASVVADGTTKIKLQMSLGDQFGNLVPISNATGGPLAAYNVTFSNASLAADGSSYTGYASSTVAYSSASTSFQLTPVGGGSAITLQKNIAFTPGPPVANASSTTPGSSFSAATPSASTDAGNQITFVVQLYDAYGNAVPGQPVVVTSTGTTNTFSIAPVGTNTGPAGSTDSTGKFQFTLASTKAEGKTLTLKVNDASGNLLFTLGPINVTFTPGVPSAANSTFTAAPTVAGTVYADGVQSYTLTLTALDANKNPVPNQVVGFQPPTGAPVNFWNVSTASAWSNGLFSGPTNSSGVFTAYATLYAQSAPSNLAATAFAGTVNLGASSPGMTFSPAMPWTLASSGLVGASAAEVAADPNDANVVYTATTAGVFKSTNKGASWSSSYVGMENVPAQAMLMVPTNPVQLFVTSTRMNAAINGYPLYKSADAGAHWTLLKLPLTPSSPRAFAFDPNNPSTLLMGTNGSQIYRSTDSGATWSLITANLPSSVLAIAFDASKSGLVYAAGQNPNTNNVLLKSTNSGATWTTIAAVKADGTRLCTTPKQLVYDQSPQALTTPQPPILYYLCDNYNDGLWSTKDLSTWTQISTGNNYLLYVKPDPKGTSLFGAGNSGQVFRTTNQGGTWTQLNSTSQTVTGFAWDPSDVTKAYASLQGVGDAPGILKTDTTGNMSVSNAGLNVPSVSLVAADPTTSSTVFTYANGVMKSADGGASWAPVTTAGAPAGQGYGMAVDASGFVGTTGTYSGLYLFQGCAGVYWLRSGATGWIQNPTPPSCPYQYVMDPNTSGTIFAFTSFSTHRTINGGANWTTMSTNSPQFDGKGPVIGRNTTGVGPVSILYGTAWNNALSARSVFKSSDSGQTWKAIYSENTGTSSLLSVAVDPTNSQNVYISMNFYYGRGAISVYSNDGGTTFNNGASIFGTNAYVAQFLIADPSTSGNVFAMSGTANPAYELFKSGDGAHTWQPANLGVGNLRVNAVVPTAYPGIVWLATERGVLKTNSGGW